MKLSIITPNRNRDAYLEQLLGSVDQQRQDGIEFEHWVCDGGSTDGSLALLKRHHPKVRVITEKDSGPADAINKGMKAATGDILAWLDADAKAGPLRLDLRAAWDYEFILRLWRQGGAVRVPGDPLACFRWHPVSISGQHFRLQFQEEIEAALADAGRYRLQGLLHRGVRSGIVGIYSLMEARRKRADRH